MELAEFLAQTQRDVRAEIAGRLRDSDQAYPYPESVFTEIVMKHMFDVGMTFFEPEICHYSQRVGSANLRISGFAVSEEADQLDLFVSLYSEAETVVSVPDSETKAAAEQCLRFLAKCAEGKLAGSMDESNDAHQLATTIEGCYAKLDQIRVYVLTDRQSKAKSFTPREINGKTVKLEVMDIERLYRHWSEGKPRDELIMNFEALSGGPLPCVYVPADRSEYEYALTAIPAEALRFMYEKHGARLLEANVRSFLSAAGKVNKGIRDTLKDAPEKFMAYNNGIVVVADAASFGKTSDGGPGLRWLSGVQIVNGGQTTASIYFTKKRSPEIDLRTVRVPAKVIVLCRQDAAAEEALISDISRYANSQNAVKQSDLSANKPFHVTVENLATTTYCPDGVGRWFYERAAGSYNTMLAREGTTPARFKQLREKVCPPSRKLTKTDLAKYMNAWERRPDVVSLGAQKSFERFVDRIQDQQSLPDVPTFKAMIAQVIIFKRAVSLVRPMFPAFQANVTAYVVSLIADRLGSRIDMEKIWLAQAISPALEKQIQTWAPEVNDILFRSANGKMISEWAKKPECWEAVRRATYSPLVDNISEIR